MARDVIQPIYAEADRTRAEQSIRRINGHEGWESPIVIQAARLNDPIGTDPSLVERLASADTIVLLISKQSGSCQLFQRIADWTQESGKRLIVIDLDNAGTGNISGTIKDYADSVRGAADPKLAEVIEAEDIWTLPDGSPYPETPAKKIKKC